MSLVMRYPIMPGFQALHCRRKNELPRKILHFLHSFISTNMRTWCVCVAVWDLPVPSGAFLRGSSALRSRHLLYGSLHHRVWWVTGINLALFSASQPFYKWQNSHFICTLPQLNLFLKFSKNFLVSFFLYFVSVCLNVSVKYRGLPDYLIIFFSFLLCYFSSLCPDACDHQIFSVVTPKCSISLSWWQDFHFPAFITSLHLYRIALGLV
jgi:hypothetical protein